MNHENFRFAPPYENSPNSSVAGELRQGTRPAWHLLAEQDIGCSTPRILDKCFVNSVLMDLFISTICHAPIIFLLPRYLYRTLSQLIDVDWISTTGPGSGADRRLREIAYPCQADFTKHRAIFSPSPMLFQVIVDRVSAPRERGRQKPPPDPSNFAPQISQPARPGALLAPPFFAATIWSSSLSSFVPCFARCGISF